MANYREIIDPDFLKEIETLEKTREITDPAFLAEINGVQQPQQQSFLSRSPWKYLDIPDITSPSNFINGAFGMPVTSGIGNVAAGLAQGAKGMLNLPHTVANLPHNIGKEIPNIGNYPHNLGEYIGANIPNMNWKGFNAPAAPEEIAGIPTNIKGDWGKPFRPEDQGLMGRFTEGAAEFMPSLIGGRAVLSALGTAPKLASLLSSGMAGLTTNPEKPITGTALGAGGEVLLPPLNKGVFKYGVNPLVKHVAVPAAEKTISGLKTVGTPVETIGKLVEKIRPQKIANRYAEKYGEQGLKEIEAPSKEMFNNSLDPAKDIDMYELIKPKQSLVSPTYAKYLEKLRREPEFQELTDIFAENRTAPNAHWLQSKIGEEIGNLQHKKLKLGTLGQNDILRHAKLNDVRNALLDDIKNTLGKIDPKLRAMYEEASRLHKEVVEPSRTAARIRAPHVSGITGKVNKDDLAYALDRATREGALKKNPLPQEALDLTKLLLEAKRNKNMAMLGIPHLLSGNKIQQQLIKHLVKGGF